MYDIPIIIGFPRSGNNWVNIALECYFNATRILLHDGSTCKSYNNLIEQKTLLRENLWISGHDIKSDLDLPYGKVLYLYRDPRYVMFSDIMTFRLQCPKENSGEKNY
jgi:hypothetical protein